MFRFLSGPMRGRSFGAETKRYYGVRENCRAKLNRTSPACVDGHSEKFVFAPSQLTLLQCTYADSAADFCGKLAFFFWSLLINFACIAEYQRNRAQNSPETSSGDTKELRAYRAFVN